MRPLNQLEQQVLDLLKDAKRRIKLHAIATQLDGSVTQLELRTALDTLQIRDLVERVDTGREVVYAALATPAAPLVAPAAAAAPATAKPAATPLARSVPAGSSACAQNQKRIVDYLSTRAGYNAIGRQIFDALNISQSAFSKAVRELGFADQVRRRGSAGIPLYCLSPKALEVLGLSAKAESEAEDTSTSEFPPALATPAVQPIDTATSTAVPAVRDTYTAETEPAGPRHGLNDSNADADTEFEAEPDPLLAWHADRAQQEAANRRLTTGSPVKVAFGDLNEFFSSPLELSNAMRNTGEAIECSIGETADLDVTTSLQIDTASYALWSDGRLEIDAGDQHVSLSQPATRALIDYLDRVCAIEQH